MVLSRRALAEPASVSSSLDLREQLVKKSLSVNPALRGERSTAEVVRGLRHEAVARSKRADVYAPAQSAEAASRRAVVQTYFSHAGAEMRGRLAGLDARLAALQSERDAMLESGVAELVQFLRMLTRGEPAPDIDDAVRAQQPLLQELGTCSADILRRTRTA